MTLKELALNIYKPGFKEAKINLHIHTHEGADCLYLHTNDCWLDDIDKQYLNAEVLFFEATKKGAYEITAIIQE